MLVSLLGGGISYATNPTKIAEPKALSVNEISNESEFILWYSHISDANPDYCYEIGAYKIKNALDGSSFIPISRLYYQGALVDEHINKDLVNYGFYMLDSAAPELKLSQVDELLVLYTSGEFCGAGHARIVIGHIDNQLIKELVVEDLYEGEGVYDGFFLDQRFGIVDDQLVIHVKRGYEFVETSPNVIKNYYNVTKPFKLVSNEFMALYPEVKKELYVNAEKGLNVRRSPFLNGRKVGKIEFAKKVKVTEETDLTLSLLEDGKEIAGRWLEIENHLTEDGLPLYIFDAYLTSEYPKQVD
jgi:hypothetical protein